MTTKRSANLKKGDLVRYGDHTYVVARATVEGKVRLLGAEPDAPYVRTLVAPTRLEVLNRAPVVTYWGSTDSAEARVPIGQLLAQERERHGYSITSMAEALGVSQPYYSRVERGLHHARPSVELLERFSEVTGVDVDLLCATAGLIPRRIAGALKEVSFLHAVRALLDERDDF